MCEFKVFLDGDEIKRVITADEELGYVKYFLYESGWRALGELCQTQEEKHGDVRIEVTEH